MTYKKSRLNTSLFYTIILTASISLFACESDPFEIKGAEQLINNPAQSQNATQDFRLKCYESGGTPMPVQQTAPITPGSPDSPSAPNTNPDKSNTTQYFCVCGEDECDPNVVCTTKNNQISCETSAAVEANVPCPEYKAGKSVCSEDSTSLLTCTKDGDAYTYKTSECKNGCDNNRCIQYVIDEPCAKEGNYACDDDNELQLLKCINNDSGELVYTKVADCPYGCKDNQCVAITENMPCSESGHKTCSGDGASVMECKANKDNQLVYQERRCKYGCKDGKCLACVENSIICEDIDDNNTAVIKQCTNGEYTTLKTCEHSFSCNSDHTACGSCRNGTKKCTNDSSYTIGRIEECVKGAFAAPQVCSGNYSCNASNEACGSCQNNTTTCEEIDGIGYQKTCNNGSFTTTPCPGRVKCIGNLCNTCDENSTVCTNNTEGIGYLQTCQNNTYGNATSCKDDHSCSGNSCGACKNGSTLCMDATSGIGQLQTCSEGAYGVATACDNSASCANSTDCGECQNNSVQCYNDETGAGHRRTCVSGKYEESPCTSGSSCHENECGKCFNYSTQCISMTGKLGVCINGEYIQYDCADDLGITTSSLYKCDYTRNACNGQFSNNGNDTYCYEDTTNHIAFVLKNNTGGTLNPSYANVDKVCKSNQCNADKTDCAETEE